MGSRAFPKNDRRPDSKIDRYYLAQGQYQAAGFRLLWIRSTQKAEQDVETRARRIAQILRPTAMDMSWAMRTWLSTQASGIYSSRHTADSWFTRS